VKPATFIGAKCNIAHLFGHKRFEVIVRQEVTFPILGPMASGQSTRPDQAVFVVSPMNQTNDFAGRLSEADQNSRVRSFSSCASPDLVPTA
jgi:hypothetical protein